MRFLVLVALIAVSTSAPAPLFAQGIPVSVEPLTLRVAPLYPKPYDPVTLTVESTLLDLAASDITFTKDGTVVGEGSRSIKTTVGAPGTKTIFRVSVVSAEGTYTKDFVIAPADVALILEPVSTAHPLYDGARLVAPESRVRLIALPDLRSNPTTKLDPSTLSYTWRLGDRILEAESGIGKNVLTATSPTRFRDADITVTVTSRDKSIVAEARRSVTPAEPSVRIYRSDPLRGIEFSSALTGSFSMQNPEEGLYMVPFFFGGTPTLSWTLNGSTAGADAGLTLRTSDRSVGTAALRAIVRGGGNGTLPEIAEQGLTVRFGDVRGTGIFGI